MTTPVDPSASNDGTPILLVEDDQILTFAITELLGVHGFVVRAVSDPATAIALLATSRFSLVLTDYRFGSREQSERLASQLLQGAGTTPVGCMTGAVLSGALQSRYSFVLTKPFTLMALLACVAPWSAPQKEDPGRSQVIASYFAELGRRNWDQVAALCSPEVRYQPPIDGAQTGVVEGRDAFRRHTEDAFAAYPDVRFDRLHVIWLPRGALVEFRSCSTSRTGREGYVRGTVLFTFEGQVIVEIQVALDPT